MDCSALKFCDAIYPLDGYALISRDQALILIVESYGKKSGAELCSKKTLTNFKINPQ